MSAYIVCQERYLGSWAVSVYTVSNCCRIVQSSSEELGFVHCGSERHAFKGAMFANNRNFLDAIEQVDQWCAQDNESEEKEAKDGQHAPE